MPIADFTFGNEKINFHTWSYIITGSIGVKGRASDNPLILHVGNFEMIDMVCKNINSTEKRLIDTFFPGPLTVVLEKSDLLP